MTIENIISQSGNKFHCEVVNYLRSENWEVEISPFYSDSLSNKPREIDIIAEKVFPIELSFGRYWGNVVLRLFIECKYINNTIAFWFDKKDTKKTTDLLERNFGLSTFISDQPVRHHRFFILDDVAKLYTSGRDSQDNDVIYKAINQSLNALVYYRDNNILGVQVNKHLRTIHYPVIVCQDFKKFFKVSIGDLDKYETLKEKFCLELNYVYPTNGSSKSEYFLIDVVDFSNFSDYLKDLEEKDLKSLWHHYEYNSD